jgi:hypothetical protein
VLVEVVEVVVVEDTARDAPTEIMGESGIEGMLVAPWGIIRGWPMTGTAAWLGTIS